MDENPKTERPPQFLQKDAAWPISFYNFNGECVRSQLGEENLLELLLSRERFLCDSNSAWKAEASKKGNKSKVFIIGHTVLDEAENLYGNIFGNKLNCANENVFFFTTSPPSNGRCYLAIERYNPQTIKRHDAAKLKRWSRERMKKADPKHLESECDLMAQVCREKQNIHSVFKDAEIDLDNLPPMKISEQVRRGIVQFIRSVSPKCFMDFQRSMNIAGLCYAAVLLERDDVGKKARDEFNQPNRRNILGDVLLLRDALWFKARVLSNDGGVRRMAEYLDLSEMKVTGIA